MEVEQQGEVHMEQQEEVPMEQEGAPMEQEEAGVSESVQLSIKTLMEMEEEPADHAADARFVARCKECEVLSAYKKIKIGMERQLEASGRNKYIYIYIYIYMYIFTHPNPLSGIVLCCRLSIALLKTDAIYTDLFI